MTEEGDPSQGPKLNLFLLKSVELPNLCKAALTLDEKVSLA